MRENKDELKAKVESTRKQKARKLSELQRRQIKQEYSNRRNNIKFFGIRD